MADLVGSAPGKLAWRCRRGMKELDLVLTGYLREHWPAAGADERQHFESILELPDPELAAYLMGRETPVDPALQPLLEILRSLQSAAVATAASATARGA
jgi:antitoxin CptB